MQFNILICLSRLRPSCRWFIEPLPLVFNLSSTSGYQWQQMIFLTNSINKEYQLSCFQFQLMIRRMIGDPQLSSQEAIWRSLETTKLSWVWSLIPFCWFLQILLAKAGSKGQESFEFACLCIDVAFMLVNYVEVVVAPLSMCTWSGVVSEYVIHAGHTAFWKACTPLAENESD